MEAQTTISSAALIALHKMRRFIIHRRVPISIICFAALITFDLVVLQTRPVNPFQWHLQSILGNGLVMVGLFIRGWSAGTLRKFQELTTIGPYALVRNPLYVGSFLMMYGFALLLNDWLSIAFIALPMTALYYSQVRFEEACLAGSYPNQWPQYAANTPRFVPTHWNADSMRGFSFQQWSRNREYQAILGAAIGLLGIAALATYVAQVAG